MPTKPPLRWDHRYNLLSALFFLVAGGVGIDGFTGAVLALGSLAFTYGLDALHPRSSRAS